MKTKKNCIKKVGGANNYKIWVERCCEENGFVDGEHIKFDKYEGEYYFTPHPSEDAAAHHPHIHFFKDGGCGYPEGRKNKLLDVNKSNFTTMDDKLIAWGNIPSTFENARWQIIVHCLRNKMREYLGKPTLEEDAAAAAEAQRLAEERAELDRYYKEKKMEFQEIIDRIGSVLNNTKLNLVIKTILYPRHNLTLCQSTIKSTFGPTTVVDRKPVSVVEVYYKLLTGLESYVNNTMEDIGEDERAVFKYLMLLRFCSDYRDRPEEDYQLIKRDNNIYYHHYDVLKSRLNDAGITVRYIRTLMRSVGSIDRRSHPVTRNLERNIRSVARRARKTVKTITQGNTRNPKNIKLKRTIELTAR
jgi:hypothetical protein